MLSHRVTALFFIPRSAGDHAREELAARAGIRELRDPPERGGPAFGVWDGFGYAEVELLPLSDHSCLMISLSSREFQDMRVAHDPAQPLPLAADGALPLAIAFRDACVQLDAEVAVLLTHHDQAGRAWIDANYWMVLGMDANALADAHAGLLFLSSRVAAGWSSSPVRDRRDWLPAGDGLLVFADQGWGRWY
jgi:hypothetical protein